MAAVLVVAIVSLPVLLVYQRLSSFLSASEQFSPAPIEKLLSSGVTKTADALEMITPERRAQLTRDLGRIARALEPYAAQLRPLLVSSPQTAQPTAVEGHAVKAMPKAADYALEGLDGELLLALHRELLKLRITEETLAARYREQEMRTPAHFGTGQEAVAVGVCAALQTDDVVFSHHRGHNHYLARGGSIYALAAELYGRADGCSGGRGGSVHLTAPDKGFIATSAILGETVSAAVGAALAFHLDKVDRAAVTFFGEGTFDEGVIYEALNYAAIKKLPVLFVCENNLYATESPLSVRQASGHRSVRACTRVQDRGGAVSTATTSRRSIGPRKPRVHDCATVKGRVSSNA